MRFVQSKRWRRFWYATLLVAIVATGLSLYLAATSSSIHYASFRKMKPGMPRSSVEALLGGPAMEMKNIDELVTRGPKGIQAVSNSDGIHPIPGIFVDYCLGSMAWESDKYGNLVKSSTEIRRSNYEHDRIASAGIWDGPEARIVASFDKEDRMIGARIIERVTWRYKLRQWLPWLR